MYILVIDLGGTSAKCAIFSKEGDLLYKFQVKTILSKILINLFEKIQNFFQEQKINFSKVIAIGLSTPGFLNSNTGIVIKAGNLDWDNFNLKKEAEQLWKKPVFIINDANAAAYGEYWKAEGKKYHSLIFYTIGTGIGGAIIINDKLVMGHQGFAGELGHGGKFQNSIICNCKQSYCLEPISSAVGIERSIQEFIKNNPKSNLAKLQNDLSRFIEIKDIKELLIKEDANIISILSESLTPLANHISILLYALNPQAVIIGGGPSALEEHLINIIKNLIKNNTTNLLYDNCVFKTSSLNNDAGIYGTYYFTRQNL